MSKHSILAVTFLLVAAASLAHAADDPDTGKKAEQRACVACHSLRLIESQRLSPAAWHKEVDKMIGWGAVVPDPQLIIDYLAQHYSNTQPPPVLALSSDKK
jgi:quinoprotein glucose dehydrogenase